MMPSSLHDSSPYQELLAGAGILRRSLGPARGAIDEADRARLIRLLNSIDRTPPANADTTGTTIDAIQRRVLDALPGALTQGAESLLHEERSRLVAAFAVGADILEALATGTAMPWVPESLAARLETLVTPVGPSGEAGPVDVTNDAAVAGERAIASGDPEPEAVSGVDDTPPESETQASEIPIGFDPTATNPHPTGDDGYDADAGRSIDSIAQHGSETPPLDQLESETPIAGDAVASAMSDPMDPLPILDRTSESLDELAEQMAAIADDLLTDTSASDQAKVARGFQDLDVDARDFPEVTVDEEAAAHPSEAQALLQPEFIEPQDSVLSDPEAEMPGSGRTEDTTSATDADVMPVADAIDHESDLGTDDVGAGVDDAVVIGCVSTPEDDRQGTAHDIRGWDAESAERTPHDATAEEPAAASDVASESGADDSMDHDEDIGAVDSNQPLDPSGGMVSLDPNQPLDPSGGMVSLDPNQPLDPSGGMVSLDPNQPLDPSGGMMSFDLERPSLGFEGGVSMGEDEWGSRPLTLEESKAELLQFLVGDVREAASRLGSAAVEARSLATRESAVDTVREVLSAVHKAAESFEFATFAQIETNLRLFVDGLEFVPEVLLDEVLVRLRAIESLIEQFSVGLEVGMELTWPMRTLTERVQILMGGQQLHADLLGWHQNDPERVLELDLVVEGIESPPRPPSSAGQPGDLPPPPVSTPNASSSSEASPDGEVAVPVLRVEAHRIEELGDQVGRLVLCKNRLRKHVEEIAGQLRGTAAIEAMRSLTEEFDLISSVMQSSLMSTRKQPIDRLFRGYCRAVRDSARISGKEVELRTEGGETLVDRVLLDTIADPLIGLLRFCVSSSIERIADREAANKTAAASVTISAESRGTHLVITIMDDGRGVTESQRDSAFEAGLVGDRADTRGVFEAMFHPSMKESSLAGIRTSLDACQATIDVSATTDDGASIMVVVPLEAAILPAMMVVSGESIYAIPLQSILEIVRMPDERTTLAGQEIIRVRGDAFPVVRLHRVCENPGEDATREAVVVQTRETAFALGVDGILGQREIVLRQLDRSMVAGPFCGVTIREDGGLSLVIDPAKLAASTLVSSSAAAAAH